MTERKIFALGTAAAIAALAACRGDGTVSPAAVSTPSAVRANAWSKPTGVVDTLVTRFKVQPNQPVREGLAGGHQISFAAGSICDPATSGYGPETWEAPCERSQKAVTVTARSWVDSAGHPFVEFSPALRFTPDDARPVRLVLVYKKGTPEEMKGLTILYCAENHNRASCVDEALKDPELITYRDEKRGFLTRRIKHFSGYNITTGTSIAAE